MLLLSSEHHCVSSYFEVSRYVVSDFNNAMLSVYNRPMVFLQFGLNFRLGIRIGTARRKTK
jgi:hypothetical protein